MYTDFVYKVVVVSSLALALPHHTASELHACNNTVNGSCSLNVDKVRNKGSPNR